MTTVDSFSNRLMVLVKESEQSLDRQNVVKDILFLVAGFIRCCVIHQRFQKKDQTQVCLKSSFSRYKRMSFFDYFGKRGSSKRQKALYDDFKNRIYDNQQ